MKKLILALNYSFMHTKQKSDYEIGNILTQIKLFVCEIADMAIEKFLIAQSLDESNNQKRK
jgi:hypothetical protein